VARTYKEGPRELPGVDWKFEDSERRILRLISNYGAEYAEMHRRYAFSEVNPYFKGFDALALYLMLRDLKPNKLIEVGQGMSTRVALWALEKNAQESGVGAEFVSIDAYARASDLPAHEHVRMTLIERPLQAVDFGALLPGCQFLFVDSSHVYKFGSDVALEFTELYPRLLPGTVLHLHDIYSPYEYPVEWMVHFKRFWNEQYFLECFLMFNKDFEVLLPMNLLTQRSKAMVEAVRKLPLPDNFLYRGSSIYLLRK
jgi:hypothetical protein